MSTAQKTRSTIEDDLRQIVREIFPDRDVEMDRDTPLFNGGLSLNSTQMIELTLAFETFYGIELEPEQLTVENFSTLGTLSELIEDFVSDQAEPA